MQYIKASISLAILLVVGVNVLQAQQKYEKEYRLATEQVPASALAMIAAIDFDAKIRWYKEEGLESTSIEAKTKHKAERYSIEFDEQGRFQDLEIKRHWKTVPAAIWQQIDQILQQHLDHYKIDKLQYQYTADPALVIAFVNEHKNIDVLKLQYELVVKGVKNKEAHWYEFTFSDAGEFLSKKTIVFSNTDHLEY